MQCSEDMQLLSLNALGGKLSVGTVGPLPDRELFALIESTLGVRFIAHDGATEKIAAEVSFTKPSGTSVVGQPAVPCLQLTNTENLYEPREAVHEKVTFANHLALPKIFRGRVLTTGVPRSTPSLELLPEEVVLASSAIGPVWTYRLVEGRAIFRSSLALPVVRPRGGFSDVFSGEEFLALLPLICFLREMREDARYFFPPLRASFIIDDPNLHWPSYGFIDYRQLSCQAEKENYHLAFATIPLDSWFTHEPTAELFRRQPKRLSLLVHGNNHSRGELAKQYSAGARQALVRQALRRIERLERKAQLRVSRVMVPPHGACSSNMLSDLANFGFESACISTNSVRAHNAEQPWTRALGYLPAEVIEGCTVLPRWGLTGPVENSMLLAAYLGKAMILRGHHQDFKHGSETFDQFSRFINSLGDVRWSNMADLSRSSYMWRMEGGLCRLTPLGSVVNFPVPSGASRLVIDQARSASNNPWYIRSAEGSLRALQPGEEVEVGSVSTGELCIERGRLEVRAPTGEQVASLDARLIVRRLLTEARDRLLSF